MVDRVEMARQMASNTLRMGWYTGINWLLKQQARSAGAASDFTPTKPVPSRDELLAAVNDLMRRDARDVANGIAPGGEEGLAFLDYLDRLRAMFRDVPQSVKRREARETTTSHAFLDDQADDVEIPDYFSQDFHFQNGGYFSQDSARLYDLQVETLFYGAAAAMRRAALRPIAASMAGRDQRQVQLADVACGTGRLLRDIRRVYPAMKLTGVDLSRSYLDEAERHMGNLRPARWLHANAEALPLENASQDIVTSVFLFHELPPEVRRRVASELARVLKPGGLMVFIDSLQMGDRPGWDGLLEAFPVRFHEPYFRHYAIDDLEAVFAQAGLEQEQTENVFLSKMMVRRKAA